MRYIIKGTETTAKEWVVEVDSPEALNVAIFQIEMGEEFVEGLVEVNSVEAPSVTVWETIPAEGEPEDDKEADG